MRIIGEIPHPDCKISIFYINQKYIVKFEKGNFEQSYKISEFDFLIKSIEDIKTIVDLGCGVGLTTVLETLFIEKVNIRFQEMNEQFNEALKDY